MIYCTDTDLLLWEPLLFRDAPFAGQTLLKGSANLNGTKLTLAGASLADARIAAGMVVTLGGAAGGCYPIVSVDNASELTLSVLYDGLYPAEGNPPQPVAAGVLPTVDFAISTFQPQARIVSGLLDQAAGIAGTASPVVINREALRRPCALGTLQLIYNALAAAGSEPSRYANRAELYRRLYRRAVYETKVELDLDGDGRSDCTRPLNALRLERV